MSDRTTIAVSESTKERLDEELPAGPSMNDRLIALLDDDGGGTATDLAGVEERLDELETLVDALPDRTAEQVERRIERFAR